MVGEQVPIPGPIQGEPFLMGKIPMPWLQSASRLGGKALNVGVQLWFRARMCGSGRVSVSVSALSQAMGFERTSGHRAIRALQDAGLIEARQVAGRNTEVTLLWPARAPASP
jgi:hypothetical protein